MPDFGRLDGFLSETGHDGYLIDAADADGRYLSGFSAPDPYVTLYAAGQLWLLVSELEYGRARSESRADAVRRLSDYGYADRRAEVGDAKARIDAITALLAEVDVEDVAVPTRFPLGTADGLREHGVTVSPDPDGVVTEIRAVKAPEEIEHIGTAQRAAEAAVSAAESLLASAALDGDHLVHDGEVLTAERVKEEIEVTLLRHGCGLDDTIVAGGEEGAEPHNRGSGPLPVGEPIVVDVFPRHKASGYHADMTRTFVRGDPAPAVRERYDLTHQALEAALDAIGPGVTGAEVHDAACDVYEAAGHATLRSDPAAETGFIHSTGHGVGLDVHELPRLGPDGGELEPGNVVTVEPGLYDSAVGGVRIEDLVVVTEAGYENLTGYPKSLVV